LDDLQQSKCITVEDETEVAPLNLGMIAAYYYIKYTTVELFSRSLQQKTKLKGILEILSAASEFETIQVRHREELILRKLAHHLPLKVSGGEQHLYTDIPSKCNILMQTYFSRIPLPPIIQGDQSRLLPDANRLLQAMVDVLSSAGWLTPALACMELSQMITQGMWNTDSPLLQLPHMTTELVEKCKQAKIETISDLMEMEDDKERNTLLGLSVVKMQDIALFCNNYPDIELTFQIQDKNNLSEGEKVMIKINLKRDPDDDETDENADLGGVPRISASRYPQPKTEGWWLVLGTPEKNELVSIKRVNMTKRTTVVTLDFVAPTQGKHHMKLFFMSKSGVGRRFEICMFVYECLTMLR
jgi:pre-mRNA-splicing helicase BRR2